MYMWSKQSVLCILLTRETVEQCLCGYVQDGLVYAVEFSSRSGRDLINVAKKRTNIIPIIEDARHPHKYRMLLGKTQVIGTNVTCTLVICVDHLSFVLWWVYDEWMKLRIG